MENQESTPSGVRIYHQARSAHLERLTQFVPGKLIYRSESYDFDPALDEKNVSKKVAFWGLFVPVVKGQTDFIEINEPLNVTSWPSSVPLALLIRVLRSLRPNLCCRVSSYCIENFDPQHAFSSKFHMPRGMSRALVKMLGGIVWGSLDRVAFGTPGSLNLYERYFRTNVKEIAEFPSVPSRCSCQLSEKTPGTFVFLGSFEERKGIEVLMRAWSDASTRGGFVGRLLIMGKGPLLEDVADFQRKHPSSVTLKVDPPRDEIHSELSRADNLILLSQPTPRWREQVGLPIMEGLAHGMRILTTDETGMAGWLGARGHSVMNADASPRLIADQIEMMSGMPVDHYEMSKSLPLLDQRVAADRWMNLLA